jgi:Ca2+-binding EF-hand superfamily protein
MRSSKTIMTILAIVVTTAAASLFVYMLTPASAQDARGQAAKRLQDADKDKDGFISREEARALPRLSRSFDEIDTNRDNKLSREELIAFRDKSRR